MHTSILQRTVPLAALLTGLTGLGACGAPASVADKPPPGPDKMVYVMTPGQSVALTPTHTLTLERVNDSRCRTGAVCVWAGYISYSFTLSGAAGASSFVLSDTMPGGVKTLTRERLTFALLGVEPAAVPALNAPPPHYRVTVKVSLA